jgi:hypothetical protein
MLQVSGNFIEANRCGDDTFFGIVFDTESGAVARAERTVNAASVRLQAKVRGSFSLDIGITISCGIADIEKCEGNSWFESAAIVASPARNIVTRDNRLIARSGGKASGEKDRGKPGLPQTRMVTMRFTFAPISHHRPQCSLN